MYSRDRINCIHRALYEPVHWFALWYSIQCTVNIQYIGHLDILGFIFALEKRWKLSFTILLSVLRIILWYFSTTPQREEWFLPSCTVTVHISTVTQGILTVLFAVCLYPTVLGLFGMSFSACTMLQTKISPSNRFT